MPTSTSHVSYFMLAVCLLPTGIGIAACGSAEYLEAAYALRDSIVANVRNGQ
jgi:hypothetical protein